VIAPLIVPQKIAGAAHNGTESGQLEPLFPSRDPSSTYYGDSAFTAPQAAVSP